MGRETHLTIISGRHAKKPRNAVFVFPQFLGLTGMQEMESCHDLKRKQQRGIPPPKLEDLSRALEGRRKPEF